MRLKSYLLASAAILAGPSAFAQDHSHIGHDHLPGEPCISHHVLEEQLQDDKVRERFEAYQEAMQRYLNDPASAAHRNAQGKYIIPTVVHILQKGGTENISKQRVLDQIKSLNEDFQRMNADSVNTPDRFNPRAYEVSEFVFTSGQMEDYLLEQRYIQLFDRDGGQYAFYFRNDDNVDIPVGLLATLIEVNISQNSASHIAGRLADAINAHPEFTANVSMVPGGDPRLEVTCVRPGNTDDHFASGMEAVEYSTLVDGELIAHGMDVEFRLATKDPLGNCTDGIVRVFTDNTVNVRNPSGFKAVSYWNAYQYLNIWVVESIASMGTAGTVLGYAQFPCTGLLSTDGITVIAQNIRGEAPGSRTTTHEVGHWLNLIHIWGDAQCGSDQVADTPIAAGPNFNVCGNVGQPFHTQPYNLHFCDPENPDGEMFSNYMDYTSGNCQNAFTYGQVRRMEAVFGPEGCRPSIITPQNLEATGTADPYDYDAVQCAPKSLFHINQGNFYATTAMICEGGSVAFRANTYNADVDDHAWSFPGGSPETSDATNPNVTYATPGVYDVTLEASNSIGSDSRTMEDMVIVSSSTADRQSDWGYYETFWHEEDFLNDFIVFNHDGTEHTWEYYVGQNGGYSNSHSVRMRNFGNVVGRMDELITPSFNLSTVSNPTLKFRWTGAARNTSPSDQLRIFYSSNCGQSWTVRATWTDFDLVNSGLSSTSYVPGPNSTWSPAEISIPANMANAENVRVKFQWTSGGDGNNFYIDDITISGAPLSAEALESEIGLQVMPNPTLDATTVSMMLQDGAKVEMVMMDVMGRKVMDVHAGQMTSGTHRFDVDMRGNAPGIYFLRVAVDNAVTVKKVVKN